ncbi:DUF2844 domain-containing protein [Trinickia sp. Y13]|uniref:DUF2844 domain-containing protein n=1 Tax=Trinickia sp. Y13 TaxID=2917807 RepID=UPI002405EE8D|nr:DUF2844 domain-containing protein [Trinickia sp. Y13]MDG0026843.1 DUF2844 domain-containing protein [Trinickia sp. Y13]
MLNRPLRAVVRTALTTGAFAAVPSFAWAVLGGAPMTTPSGATNAVVTTAHAASAATGGIASGTSTSSPYSIRSTTFSTGTQVREYIGAGGTVFGIAWNGPRMPDLQTLLGNYFPQYASGVKAQRAARHARGPVAVEQSDLVVHSGGHMGSFFGQAWLPSALPAGLTGADIK